MTWELCRLAADISAMTDHLLAARNRFSARMRLGETTITSLLCWQMLEHNRYLGNSYTISASENTNEPTTGADLEIWFLAPDNTGSCWNVQAKMLHAPKRRTPALYKDVGHIVKGTGKRQVDLLLKQEKPGHSALYFLYGMDLSVKSCINSKCQGDCHPHSGTGEGIRVTSARQIHRLLRKTTIDFADIMPMAPTLVDLWCDSGSDRQSVVATAQAASRRLTGDDDQPNDSPVGEPIEAPEYVLQTIEGGRQPPGLQSDMLLVIKERLAQ